MEVARHALELVKEGFFRGEQKWALHIKPSNLDIDMIVLTFLIVEKRRRDAAQHADKKDAEGRGEEPCEGGIEMGA